MFYVVIYECILNFLILYYSFDEFILMKMYISMNILKKQKILKFNLMKNGKLHFVIIIKINNNICCHFGKANLQRKENSKWLKDERNKWN